MVLQRQVRARGGEIGQRSADGGEGDHLRGAVEARGEPRIAAPAPVEHGSPRPGRRRRARAPRRRAIRCGNCSRAAPPARWPQPPPPSPRSGDRAGARRGPHRPWRHSRWSCTRSASRRAIAARLMTALRLHVRTFRRARDCLFARPGGPWRQRRERAEFADGRTTMRSRTLFAAALGLCIAWPASAQPPDKADEAAARKEASLSWYTSTPVALAQALADKFEQRHRDQGPAPAHRRPGGAAAPAAGDRRRPSRRRRDDHVGRRRRQWLGQAGPVRAVPAGRLRQGRRWRQGHARGAGSRSACRWSASRIAPTRWPRRTCRRPGRTSSRRNTRG